MDFIAYAIKIRCMKSTKAQFTAYQQIFDYFNRTLFDSSLPDCMLSFCRLRSNSHSLFTSEQWREEAGSTRAEISLNMKQLCENEPIKNVMATLVREMVHLWQEKYGKPSSKWYFNQEWAGKMKEIGLIPSTTGLPGGKQTGQGVKHFIEPDGRFERAFQEMPPAHLWPFRTSAFESRKVRGYSGKEMYRCSGCGTKIWGKKGLGLMCECGRVFASETGETKAGLEEKMYRILAKKYG
jgi:hypothetical protein